MKCAIVVGSQRPVSESARVGEYITQRLASLGHTSGLMDLGKNPIAMWNPTAWDDNGDFDDVKTQLADFFADKDAVVFISPEYMGMASPALKNLCLFLSARHVGHKPCLLVTVSSGKGGSYPVSELRASSYKNNKMCYIPEHLIVRQCESMFTKDGAPEGLKEEEALLKKRFDFSLTLLGEYAKALQTVRDTGKTFDSDFANGM